MDGGDDLSGWQSKASCTSFRPIPLFYRVCGPKRVEKKVRSVESCKQGKGSYSSFGDGRGVF